MISMINKEVCTLSQEHLPLEKLNDNLSLSSHFPTLKTPLYGYITLLTDIVEGGRHLVTIDKLYVKI